MTNLHARVFALAVVLTSTSAAAAETPLTFNQGDELAGFALRAVNSSKGGLSGLVSLDSFFTRQEAPAKVLIMSFFATYCGPCKKELPYLQALYEAYHDRGLDVFVISIDKEPEKIDELKKLGADAKITFPILWDRFNMVAKRYNISKLPCLYIVGADKKVINLNVGYGEDASPRLLNWVQTALSISTDTPVPERVQAYLKRH
jgi:thiol-disulfide isomerase/thioredoxin